MGRGLAISICEVQSVILKDFMKTQIKFGALGG